MLQPVVEGQEIAYQLISLRQVIDQLEVQFSRLAAELDGTVYWAEDGSNSSIDWIRFNCHEIENQVLLCSRHHRLVHERGWQLIKTEEGEIVSIAPTISFGLPRDPD